MKDLNALGHSFQTVMTEALELEQQHVVTARNSVDVSHGGGGGGGDQNEYNAALLEYVAHRRDVPHSFLCATRGCVGHARAATVRLTHTSHPPEAGTNSSSSSWSLTKPSSLSERQAS